MTVDDSTPQVSPICAGIRHHTQLLPAHAHVHSARKRKNCVSARSCTQKTATAIEHGEARHGFSGGLTPKKWGSAMCGKKLIKEQVGRHEAGEQDRQAPMRLLPDG